MSGARDDYLEALPHSMGPFEQISGSLDAVSPVYPSSKTLPFSIEGQQDTNWCWAAVAYSIALYYTDLEGDPPPDMQCKIAETFIGVSCCPPKSNPNGNKDRPLVLPLLQYGYLRGSAAIGHPISFADIQKDICDGHPVCCRLATAVGHFIVVVGYSQDGGEPHIVVADPAGLLHGAYPLDTFDQAAGAPWNETYRTKKKRNVS